MASTKQLLTSVGSSASLAVAAVAQALDPKGFPWDVATILRVSGNNPHVARALGQEAVLTLPTTPKARKAPKAPKVKPMSAFLKAALADAAVLVAHLKALGSNDVMLAHEGEAGRIYIATLGDPTVGPKGGVQVLCTLTFGKKVVATYELSGKQAARLFAGGNCGTTVGHVLKSA